MLENINRVEDFGNIYDFVYENMFYEQVLIIKIKKYKIREKNVNYMREYRVLIVFIEENEK